MEDPIRHHYVPQTYLKKFSFRKRNSDKVFAMDKKSKKIFEANIEDVSVEKHFYTIKTNDGKENNYYWEHFYADFIEPFMGKLITDLIKKCEVCLVNDHTKVLTDELKNNLSITIIFQLLRGKHTREFFKKVFKELKVDIIKDVIISMGEKEGLIVERALNDNQMSNNIFKVSVLKAILEEKRILEFASLLLNRTWQVYRLVEKAEFVTSDNPTLVINRLTLDPTPFRNGLGNDNTVVYYPVSSKLLIAIYADDTLLGQLQKKDGYLTFVNDTNERFINMVNRKQLEQCTRQIYAQNSVILEKIREMERKN